MKNFSFKKINKLDKGALLFELLIVISVLAIILTVGANATFLSMQSNKISGERDKANALATEALEAVKAITDENWQNIYGLTKATQHYHPVQSAGKWILNSGDASTVLNGITYTSYIVIDNISRDDTTRDIDANYVVADDDPSTQKVTATVSWTGGDTVVLSSYLFRWKNKICGQSGWATGGSGDTVKACTDSSYDTKDSTVDVSGGTLKLQ